MILIVGLGNIGRQYKDTPHNVGFEFLDTLRKQLIDNGYDSDLWKNEGMFFSIISKIRKNGELEILLCKPTTYMNLSGKAVSKLIEKFKPNKVIIVHDDLDIKGGEYKIQVGKGPKDHNGVLSIESVKGSDKFERIRIGVETREKENRIPGDIYVIKKMDDNSLNIVNDAIQKAVLEIIQTIVE